MKCLVRNFRVTLLLHRYCLELWIRFHCREGNTSQFGWLPKCYSLRFYLYVVLIKNRCFLIPIISQNQYIDNIILDISYLRVVSLESMNFTNIGKLNDFYFSQGVHRASFINKYKRISKRREKVRGARFYHTNLNEVTNLY